jgi:hypothetical protein
MAIGTLGVAVALVFCRGGSMFSPGALNGQSRARAPLGGVASHADLANNCSACHVPPWSKETMATRCLDCHTDVRQQLDSQRSLHGLMSDGMQCRKCHTEHKGAHGAMTSMALFDHDWSAFKLTGKHRAVDCRSCHTNEGYKGTPQSCVSCHAEPEWHKGKFGTACAQCHSTSTWQGATFKHTFPLHHGTERRRTNSCTTCHTKDSEYRTYTCYGCHQHRPAEMERRHAKLRVADIQKCAECHPTGHKSNRRRAAEDGPGLEICRNCPGACAFGSVAGHGSALRSFDADDRWIEEVLWEARGVEAMPTATAAPAGDRWPWRPGLLLWEARPDGGSR